MNLEITARVPVPVFPGLLCPALACCTMFSAASLLRFSPLVVYVDVF